MIAMPGYAELHCHSHFSLLDGASSPEDLLSRAWDLGMPALALTDHDGLYGAPRFYKEAKRLGIKPILGAELILENAYHITLLARNMEGYSNLCRLITRGQLGGSKGSPSLSREALGQHSGGLFCLSGCRKGEVPGLLLQGKREEALRAARSYASVFGPGSFFIELQDNLCPGDKKH